MENLKLMQDSTKFTKEWVRAELKDLVIGFRFIHVEINTLTPLELKNIDFHIHEVRKQLRMNNGKFELLHKYTEYKNDIKKWVSKGVIFKHEPIKPEVKKKEVKLNTLFNEQ